MNVSSTFALIKNGEGGYFDALCGEIARAEKLVHIETYICVSDAATAPIFSAMKAAVARGVAVRLLIDGIGSKAFLKTGGETQLASAGIELRVFNRDDYPLSFARERLRRLHRKVAVIDERIAFVGGVNLVSDFAPPNPLDAAQFDYAVKIAGPLVSTIYRNAMDVWSATSSKSLRRKFLRAVKKMPTLSESANAAFVFRDNFRNRRSIEKMMLDAIARAKTEIILANAYFLPGWRFRRALQAAARRGVKVTLLLQGFTDHAFLRAATRHLYARMFEDKVYVAEYARSMLHAKVCVIDGVWATVGSSNLDPFSLLLAREANIAVSEPAFAHALRASLLEELQTNAASIAPTLWAQRPWREKAVSAIAYRVAKFGLHAFGLRAG